MNLSKLAKLANVSVSTVSKAFSESSEISEITKNHIFNIAKENGCFERYYKPQYQKKLIGVICPEIVGVHYSQMATYFEREITACGATMALSVSNFSPKLQQELVDYYIQYAHANGVIVIEPVDKIKNSSGAPIVQIGKEYESMSVDCIHVDIRMALEEAVRYLDRMGHKKIGFIGETFATNEYEAFKTVVQKKCLSISDKHIVISNKRFYDAGYYGVGELLNRSDLPTAIFAAYSHIAVGILQRLKEEKIRVPEDISLICMDDISSMPYPDMHLSCIKMHLDELCAIAIDLLNKKLDNSFLRTRQSISVTRKFDKGASIQELL